MSKKIKEKEIIKELEYYFGKEYIVVLEILLDADKKKKKKDENMIAKLLKKDVHDVRKILYHLQNLNLVFSKFWKINENGWHVNSWHINLNEILRFLENKKIEKKDMKEEKGEEIEGTFFVCPFCSSKYDYFEAIDISFICSNCGSVLQNFENEEINSSLVEKEYSSKADNSVIFKQTL